MKWDETGHSLDKSLLNLPHKAKLELLDIGVFHPEKKQNHFEWCGKIMDFSTLYPISRGML